MGEMLSRIVLLSAVVALALPAAAPAAMLPPPGKVLAGVSGGTSVSSFAAETGASPGAMGFFTRWYGPWEYIFAAAERADATLVLHLSTTNGQGAPEAHTPLALARGEGDGYLVRLNRRLSEYGKPVYVRLLSEMNQADNSYAAFDHSGRSRGRAHSTRAFRHAWRRTTLILRGGPLARINARLAKLRLPAVTATKADLPRPQVDMMWVPQTRGTPDKPANMPRAYWPGAGYVDWVGTDFYSRYPNFHWLEDFYRSFPSKPFVFGEWAMWGGDHPAFVKRLFAWIGSHPRVKMVLYNQGRMAGGPFRLARYPRAKAELRRQLGSRRFRP